MRNFLKQIWSWWKIDTQYFMLIWCLKTFQSCLRNVSSFYSFVSFIPLNDKIIEVVCDWCSILIQLFLGCVNSSWSAFLFFPRGVHDFSLSFFNSKTRNSSVKIVCFCNSTVVKKREWSARLLARLHITLFKHSYEPFREFSHSHF